MDTERRQPTEPSKAPRTLRGELALAAIGFAITAVFLASMWAAAWWAVRSQQAAAAAVQTDRARQMGGAIARSAEVMLASDELTSLRRMIVETALDAGLARCRVVLPNGGIIADAAAGNITVHDLPAKWSGAADGMSADAGPAAQAFTIMVPGRGIARLEVEAKADVAPAPQWQTQAGIGAIAVVALLMLMLLYRRATKGLMGMWAIRQALMAREGGQTSPAALEVNPCWGPEAAAWNDLMTRETRRQKQSALAKTRELLQARGCNTDQIASACDAISQGLILVEKDMRASYVNSAAAILCQCPREEMVAAEISAFIHDERVLAAARAAAEKPLQRRAIFEVHRNADSGAGLLRFIVRPVRCEDSGVAMIIIEDITQQRVAEEARNAFVAQATHELRTPLTNIRLYAERAIEDGKDSPVIIAECLNVINQEAFRLDRIVGAILSIAEIEAGTLALKQDDVRLDEVFLKLQSDYDAQAQEKQIRLTFNLPPKLPVIKGDREKIVLALHNLLGNALKYTTSGGQVTVTVAASDGQIAVDVADTGFGMSEEDCKRIFEKFYRSKDRRVGQITGSGLGLAIAREVVRLHGGDITVDSELDKGSTFTLTLPSRETG